MTRRFVPREPIPQRLRLRDEHGHFWTAKFVSICMFGYQFQIEGLEGPLILNEQELERMFESGEAEEIAA